MSNIAGERKMAAALEADIEAINDEEMLCIMHGDAETIAKSLVAMGWRK